MAVDMEPKQKREGDGIKKEAEKEGESERNGNKDCTGRKSELRENNII